MSRLINRNLLSYHNRISHSRGGGSLPAESLPRTKSLKHPSTTVISRTHHRMIPVFYHQQVPIMEEVTPASLMVPTPTKSSNSIVVHLTMLTTHSYSPIRNKPVITVKLLRIAVRIELVLEGLPTQIRLQLEGSDLSRVLWVATILFTPAKNNS